MKRKAHEELQPGSVKRSAATREISPPPLRRKTADACEFTVPWVKLLSLS